MRATYEDPMFKVKSRSGSWSCGCDDVGSVTDVDVVDDEVMYYVGTPCGWSWIPATECVDVPFASCCECGADMTGKFVEFEDGRVMLAEDADEDIYCGPDCIPDGLTQMIRRREAKHHT